MRNLKGVGLLFIEVVDVIATDPDCMPTAVVVTWTDLGETYQLERSADNGANWNIVYTGTDFTKSESFPNVDASYSYRVKVLFTDIYSNVSTVTPKEQNKIISNNCYPAFNVAPYYRRQIVRTLCATETPTDNIDLTCCQNDNAITFEDCLSIGVAPYTYRVTRYNNCTQVYTNTDTDNDSRCMPNYWAGTWVSDNGRATHNLSQPTATTIAGSWTSTNNIGVVTSGGYTGTVSGGGMSASGTVTLNGSSTTWTFSWTMESSLNRWYGSRSDGQSMDGNK